MNYKKYEELPPLYGTEKNGKTKIWKAVVYYDDVNKCAMSSIEFGQLEGKKQTASREYKEGKNIGKKNETTPLQQCVNETKKKWSDKKEKESYTENFNNINNINNEEKEDVRNSVQEDNKYFPMLAHTYDPNSNKKKKTDIVFPCYVQPKLDGLRCIMYTDKKGNVLCQSRTGSYFETMDHISQELKSYLKGKILDGELYTNEMPFEELAGLIKKKKITEEDKQKLINVKYHVYDIIDENKKYLERYIDILNLLSEKQYKYVVSVPTHTINSINMFKKFFGEFIEMGYEGIMLRNTEGIYRCNYRSHDLQKYKEFKESEYTITGFKEGDGRDKGTVIWICKTEDDKEFSVRPKGTMESRREFFENGKNYIGKKLTVIYQELSEMGVPRFPVGKDVREEY